MPYILGNVASYVTKINFKDERATLVVWRKLYCGDTGIKCQLFLACIAIPQMFRKDLFPLKDRHNPFEPFDEGNSFMNNL